MTDKYLLFEADRDLLRELDPLDDTDLRARPFSLLFPFGELLRFGDADSERLFDFDLVFSFIFGIDLKIMFIH